MVVEFRAYGSGESPFLGHYDMAGPYSLRYPKRNHNLCQGLGWDPRNANRLREL